MLSAGLGGSGRVWWLKLSAQKDAASEVILCGKNRCPGYDYLLMNLFRLTLVSFPVLKWIGVGLVVCWQSLDSGWYFNVF